jgi:hypothetical protein
VLYWLLGGEVPGSSDNGDVSLSTWLNYGLCTVNFPLILVLSLKMSVLRQKHVRDVIEYDL